MMDQHVQQGLQYLVATYTMLVQELVTVCCGCMKALGVMYMQYMHVA